ncbi:hypothetical protein G9P44_001625 [Scheffersomyces stipitis]|nr:hypothetical protein G9P44_001625 [Scheffersomyces stipitis]
MHAVKKRFSSNSSANGTTSPKKKERASYVSPVGLNSPRPDDLEGLSPELVPIVTLLSSQSHRRYHEGIFMLYYDLNGDGKPADREWKEVYGILTGCQLAYWDAANLAQFRNNPDALLETSAKPNYINFTDAVYNAMKSLPAAKQNLDNVVIVSTTLKNRYILQYKSFNDLITWYSALRLSNYEYSALQEAYSGALLSARGARLSDIRTILAEKRFDHEDWVSIRYGSGMAWKRCYAVIEPSQSKKKTFIPGRILFYETDQKKKKQLMAVVSSASSVTAVYPQSHQLIDHSTMLKMEAMINFKSPSLSTKVSKKVADDYRNTSIFIMPEQHSSVPGFDTLIRFFVPLLDTFGLYGRPKRLKANRTDPDSLLFGLPTLPFVHYLELQDVLQLAQNGDFLSWEVKAWTSNIKAVIKQKLDRGYEGCGSQRGLVGALSTLSSPGNSRISTPTQSQHSVYNSRDAPPLPTAQQYPQKTSDFSSPTPPPPEIKVAGDSSSRSRNIHDLSINVANGSNGGTAGASGVGAGVVAGAVAGVGLGAAALDAKDNHKSVHLDDIYHKYSTIQTPSDQYQVDRNELLNGSEEQFIEDELPVGVRKLDLEDRNTNVYPVNDEDLFSEEEDDNSSEKIEARRIGMLPSSSNSSGLNQSLNVPVYNNRNSSYSSVQSPMTQYTEFNDQFSKALGKSDHSTRVQRDYGELYPSDEEHSPPPEAPPHESFSHDEPSSSYISKSGPSYNLSGAINSVPSGTTTPRNTEFPDHRSIHSESGKVSSGSSSNSEESFRRNAPEDINQYNPPSQNARPRFISSPNSSQNQIHRFESPPAATKAPANIRTPTNEVPEEAFAVKPSASHQKLQQQMSIPTLSQQQKTVFYPQAVPKEPVYPVVAPQKQSYPQSQSFGYTNDANRQNPAQPRQQYPPQQQQQQLKIHPLPQQQQQQPKPNQYQQYPPQQQQFRTQTQQQPQQQYRPQQQQQHRPPPPPQQQQHRPSPPPQQQQPQQQYRPQPQQQPLSGHAHPYARQAQQQQHVPGFRSHQQVPHYNQQGGAIPRNNGQAPTQPQGQNPAQMRGYDQQQQYEYNIQQTQPGQGSLRHPNSNYGGSGGYKR